MNDEKIFRQAMDGVRSLGNNKVLNKRRTEPSVGQRRRKYHVVHEEQEDVDPNYLHVGDVNQVHSLEILEWKKDGV